MEKPTCLFIGRFQPFHVGHLLVVKGMSKVCGKIIIGIGSSEKKWTEKNPFTAEERRDMIQRALQGVDVIPTFDVNFVNLTDKDDDAEWADHVLETTGKVDQIWTGNDWTKDCFEGKGIEIKDIKEVPGFDGTEIRKMIKTGGYWEEKVPDEILSSIKAIDGVKRIKGM